MAAKLLGDYRPPALSHTHELLQELAAAQGAAAGEEWAAFSVAISDALRKQGADGFLRLPPIAKTVHSRQRSLAPRYLSYLLRSAHFTPALQKALTESPVGQPLVNPYYPWSSPLLVQHGYHLVRLLEATDFDLARIRLVTDFGGGYGSFCRLLRNLGYRQRYLICDLPVMCALQRFYLRNVFPSGADGQPPDNVQWLSGDMQATLRRETAQARPALFVATWSLSESPLAVRNEVAAGAARVRLRAVRLPTRLRYLRQPRVFHGAGSIVATVRVAARRVPGLRQQLLPHRAQPRRRLAAARRAGRRLVEHAAPVEIDEAGGAPHRTGAQPRA